MAAAALHFQIPYLLLLIYYSFLIPTPSASRSTHQNIQVYFPIPITPPPTTVAITSSSSGSKTLAKAVAVTAATGLVFSGLLLLLFFKFKRGSKVPTTNYNHSEMGVEKNVRVGGMEGVIVDEQGLDVLYWTSLEQQNNAHQIKDNGSSSSSKSQFESPPPPGVLIGGTSSSTCHVSAVDDTITTQTLSDSLQPLQSLKTQASIKSDDAPPLLLSNQTHQQFHHHVPPPPPMPVVQMKSDDAPPHVPIVVAEEMKGNAPSPPPPPIAVIKRTGNAPLPPKTNGLTSSSPQFTAKHNMSSSDHNQARFKPLHWDKVNANVEHSMVWHKLNNGSFRVDDNLMESLFGTISVEKNTKRQAASNSPAPNPK